MRAAGDLAKGIYIVGAPGAVLNPIDSIEDPRDKFEATIYQTKLIEYGLDETELNKGFATQGATGLLSLWEYASKIAAAGAEVTVVCATLGDRGESHLDLSPPQLAQQRLLELPRAFIDDVRLFHLHDSQLITKYALGDEQPFVQRVVQHQNLVMPLTLAPGVHQIYLRMASSGTIEAPLRLWEPAAFQAAAAKEHLLAG
eukprot:gene37493-60804_t